MPKRPKNGKLTFSKAVKMAIFDILEGPWQGKMTYFRVYLKMKRT